VTLPVRAVVGRSVVWNDIVYCKNTHFLARKSFNYVPVCLEA
ncbi:hypothetical protein N322_06605, partial [Cariama cristata]